MNGRTLKLELTNYTGAFMAALLFIQPLMDVLSYFMGVSGATLFTTVLRTVLLFAVCAYSFIIADRKQIQTLFYAVIAGFWLLHSLNCLRGGYVDFIGDLGEYLKLVQFPLWTLAFITFMRHRENLDMRIAGILTLNLGIILFVILLSYVVGNPVYTYDYPERGIEIGVRGWFAVSNAQSAIVAMLAPPALAWALRKERIWLFSLACIFSFGLLYFTGTRLTYYAAILIAIVFILLIVISRESYVFCIPLLVVLVLLFAFKWASPMDARQELTAGSYAVYEEKTDEIMGEDRDYEYRGGEIDPAIKEKIRRVYEEVYGVEGLHGVTLLSDLIERFGIERVMEQYEYSTAPEILYNNRVKKLTALELIWQDQDFLTKLLGFEYAESHFSDSAYDPENDFPALLYYYGYLGCALYVLFCAYFVVTLLLWLLKNLSDISDFATPELGATALMFALALGAAQFSGNVLRRPSVTVYMAVAAALIYMKLHPVRERKMFVRRQWHSVVQRKEY